MINNFGSRTGLLLLRSYLIVFAAIFAILCVLVQVADAAPLKLTDNIKAVWADKSGLDGEFSFVVISDSVGNDRIFQKLLRQIEAIDPLFVVHVGDTVANGYTDEFRHYASLVSTLKIPMLNVAGNHDVRMDKTNFGRLFGTRNWFFDYGSYRFVALDNSSGAFTGDAVKFAHKYVNDEKACFVFFHCPPPYGRWAVHSMGGTMKSPRTAEVISIIERAKPVAVFMGHLHMYDVERIGGVPFIISGCSGSELKTQYNFGQQEYGFILMHVSKTGFKYEWVGLEE